MTKQREPIKAPITANRTVFERPEYKLSPQMQAAKAKLQGMPRPLNMGSPAQFVWFTTWD